MTPERRKKLLYVAGALLLVAVALLAVSYSLIQQQRRDADTITVPKPPDLGLPNSGLITTPPAGETTATPGSTGTSGSGSSGGLTAAEVAALQAELSAMERALDSMSMPGDSDFKDIESGLD